MEHTWETVLVIDFRPVLVVHGWLHGLSASQIEALFCGAVYDHLGYFARRISSERSILQDGAFCGIDIGPLLADWCEEDCFCYSINHPKLRVLSSYAKAALTAAGIPVAPVRPELTVPDTLTTNGTWPVYPEIAARYGVRGSLDFYPPSHGNGAARPRLPLSIFIERSLALYARVDPTRVTIHRSAQDETKFAELASLPTWPAALRRRS